LLWFSFEIIYIIVYSEVCPFSMRNLLWPILLPPKKRLSSTKIVMRSTIVPGPVPHWLCYLSEMLKFKIKKTKKFRRKFSEWK